MPRGENFAGALQEFGLSASEVNDATAAAQRAYNLRQLRAGNAISVGRSVEGTLREINYKINAGPHAAHRAAEAGVFRGSARDTHAHGSGGGEAESWKIRCSTPWRCR